jgi:hypothetical protein
MDTIPEDPMLRRIFLDSQIVYVSYSTQNEYSETSYVEGLKNHIIIKNSSTNKNNV